MQRHYNISLPATSNQTVVCRILYYAQTNCQSTDIHVYYQHLRFVVIFATKKITAEQTLSGSVTKIYNIFDTQRTIKKKLACKLQWELTHQTPIILLSVGYLIKSANVLLARIQPLADRTRRPQQSGLQPAALQLTPTTLRLLSEIHRDFDRPLQVAYLDIKAAFDSIDTRG